MFGPVVRAVEDEELIRRVAEGDDQALSELYNRYSRPVYATGIRLLGDAHLAEELAGGGFFRPWSGEFHDLALQDHPQSGCGSQSQAAGTALLCRRGAASKRVRRP
jgi:hypothetical protein